jgi:glutaredoxin
MKTLLSNNIDNKVVYYLSDDITQKCYPVKENVFQTKMPNEYYHSDWVMYGRFSCPYCMSAVELLKNNGLNDKLIFVDITNAKYFSKNEVLQKLKNIVGNHNTVPIVFNNNQFIGGHSDLQLYLNKNN